MVKNSLLNLGGLSAPVLAAFFAVPVLVRELGDERFGLLTIGWAVVGYFGLSDFGLGRALTVLVSNRLVRHEDESLGPATRSALLAMTVLGCAGGLLGAALTPWFTHRALRISPGLVDEATAAFEILACAVPLVVLGTGLRGILEGHQRFDLANVVRVPLGIFTFVGPLVMLPFTHNLAWIIAPLAAARLAGAVVNGVLCVHVMPQLRGRTLADRREVNALFRMGGWMTVSNTVSPIMVSADRLFIGALASTAVVAFYTTPFEAVTKLLYLPGAIAVAVFPAFAAGTERTTHRLAEIYRRGMALSAAVLAPAVVCIMLFAHAALAWWITPAFADQSALVLQILAFGVFWNGLAHIPYQLLQGVGRADVVAKLHLVELPLYLVLVWKLIATMGIEGAAIAWSVRATADAVALFVITHRVGAARLSAE